MATYLGNRKKLLDHAHAPQARHVRGDITTGLGPPDTGAGGVIPYYIQELQQTGLTGNRTYMSCNFINTSSGVFNWAYRQGGPDSWYTAMVNAGITPILQHIFAPSWWFTYTTGWTNSTTPYADWPPYPSADWDNFMTHNVDFATAAAARYPLAIIEISNEWNNGGIYVKPQGGQALAVLAANYAAYHAPIQAAYKAVNPTQKVIVGGLLRMDSANFSNWVAGNAIPALLKPALDALSCTPDGVSIHPYMLGAATSNPMIDGGANILSRNYWQSVGRYLNAQDAAGWHLPVYITESGFRASQTNSQGAFNTNSETTKSIWNRFELDTCFYLYGKDARPAGKSWVEQYGYYRMEEYPSPTTPSYSGMFAGDPAGGPHTQYPWGVSAQDYYTKVAAHQPIPKLETITLTGVPSTAVIGQAAVTISAAGGNIPTIPTFRESSAGSIATLSTPATGTATAVLSFPGSGTVTVTAQGLSSCYLPISIAQTIIVAAQIPTLSVITPANGWKVATSNSGTIQFTVAETDQIGNPIVSPVGTWTSSDATNAPIDPVTGLLTAVGLSANVVVTWTPTGGAGGSTATSTGDVVLNPVLQITNAPTTLINIGLVILTVTDGVNPVTGCTIVASDPTKITVSGQTIFGLGTSGTSTIKAQKAGYGDSSLSTVTSTGDKAGAATNSYLDDKDAIGLSNGAAISTYTDGGGQTWAQATGSKQPTYTTGAINGHAAITFDGVNDVLKATATVPALNDTEFTYMALLQPTNASAVANEQLLDNRNTTAGQQGGFVLGRNATTLTSDLSYYVPGPTLQQQFDGPAMTTGNWTVLIDRVSQGNQNRMLDGVVVGTSRTDATYLNPTTNPPLPTKGGNISTNPGNNFQGPVAIEGFVNRYVPDTERLQIYLRAKTYGGL